MADPAFSNVDDLSKWRVSAWRGLEPDVLNPDACTWVETTDYDRDYGRLKRSLGIAVRRRRFHIHPASMFRAVTAAAPPSDNQDSSSVPRRTPLQFPTYDFFCEIVRRCEDNDAGFLDRLTLDSFQRALINSVVRIERPDRSPAV